MSKQDQTSQKDSLELQSIMTEIGGKFQHVMQDFATRNQFGVSSEPPASKPDHIAKAFSDLTRTMMSNPARIMQLQMSLWQDYAKLWSATTNRMLGQDTDVIAQPRPGDRRFRDEAWEENPLFDFVKQSYLITARWLLDTVQDADQDLDRHTREKVEFYTKQYIDAMAPSNFLLTNPEVLRETIDTRGENLVRGLKHMLEDLERGKGRLAIRQTDYTQFRLGENIATTEGKVIYENPLMQLIQYAPATEKVAKRPLLIVPPWINKYYILDLRPENSFIRYAVEQGYTVFVVSWVNPDAQYAEAGFDEYMEMGPIAALDAIEKATGVAEVNAIGYCIGGTLLTMTLAVLAAKGDKRIKSATFFTTMIDFSHPGELGIFIDEEQISAIEENMDHTGYLDGSEMAGTFSMLRSNDLIWSFVINNYLMGKEPFPFDLLFWNSDSTRLPRAMHKFYLRNCYQENALISPGSIELLGEKVDIGKIRQSLCFVSAKDDHIAPWKSTYAGFARLKGSKKFILSGSGHIAGIVNPPARNKYCYWVNNEKSVTDPDQWFEDATRHEGSWWPEWFKWLKSRNGGMVKARKPGDGALRAIEDAPGRYVKLSRLTPKTPEGTDSAAG